MKTAGPSLLLVLDIQSGQLVVDGPSQANRRLISHREALELQLQVVTGGLRVSHGPIILDAYSHRSLRSFYSLYQL